GTVLDQKPRDDHQSCSALRRVKQRLSITGSPPLAPGSHGHHRRRAHAASPATGQGASIALDDAVILAKSLRDTGDPGGLFRSREEVEPDDGFEHASVFFYRCPVPAAFLAEHSPCL